MMRKFKFILRKQRANCQISVERFLGLTSIIILLLVLILLITNLNPYMRKKSDILESKKYSNSIKESTEEYLKLNIEDNKIEESFSIVSEKDEIEYALDNAVIPNAVKNSLREVSERDNLILDGEKLETSEDVDKLKSLIDNGRKIIFLSLPKKETIEKFELRETLGISEIKNTKRHTKLTFVKRFLLGGVHEIDNLLFETLDLDLLFSTKVFAYADTNSPVIWRNIYKESEIYVVNAPFINDITSFGIISGIMYKIEKDYIYPVINMRLTTYRGFPYISDENTENLESLYNRDAMKLQHDILIQDILTSTSRRDLIPNGFLKVGFNKEQTITDYDMKEISNINSQIYSANGDIGITYTNNERKDREIYRKILNKNPNSLLVTEKDIDLSHVLNQTSEISSIVGPWRDKSNFEYLNNDTVYIPHTVEGINQDGEDKLEFLSSITAFGAIVENLDLEDIVLNEKDQENWTKISKDYVEFIDDYRKKFEFLESRSLTNAADVVKTYNNNKLRIIKDNEEIELKFDKWQGISFLIFRTDKLIEKITGAEAIYIEEDAYFITAKQENVKIRLIEKKDKEASR